MSDFLTTWTKNTEYFSALKMLASLSGLFADGKAPYLDYRLAENVFCKYFDAINDARSCTAYDARIASLGIGIKTFILKNNQSLEKIAEFNRLKSKLDPLKGKDLARQLGIYRNDRINLANNLYNTQNRTYHVVGRTDNLLRIFNTPYDYVNIDSINVLKDDGRTFSFTDGINEYFFNKSKTVLQKKFFVPRKHFDVPVTILSDPLELLMRFFQSINDTNGKKNGVIGDTNKYVKGVNYVILPLYSTQSKVQMVPTKSGLNQWNANGRKRDANEVYIPIPHRIHELYPDFFPDRDERFILNLPDGTSLSAKVCQAGGKALMSEHNADLGKWILRKVLEKKEGELVTMDDLNRFGIDSVRIVNEHKTNDSGLRIYSISFTTSEYESYYEFSESRNDINE